MNTFWQSVIRHQFLAAVAMLENAIKACPDDVWGERADWHEFWYIAYHTLFWLDYYMESSPENYTPRAPFGLEELDPAGVLPPRVYSKAELLRYLEFARDKLRRTLDTLTEEQIQLPYRHYSTKMTFGELQLYSLRHVQHHAGQLALLLRQRADTGSRWVTASE